MSAINKTRIAILISGRGSNMVAIAMAAKSKDYPAKVCLVISNRPEAEGLHKADDIGITALAIDHTEYDARADFENELDAALKAHNIEFVVCAGFMRVLTRAFVEKWQGRIINIHPSLLPKYKGLHTHARAIDAGDTVHGCTVHWLSEGVDEGQIIDQARLDIRPEDTPDSLAARLLPLEQALYPQAIVKALNINAG
ncbi:MAG: phosphoribosylglycinamide formyltransferase [Litorimonas sp.]